jgi:hypothetical protein
MKRTPYGLVRPLLSGQGVAVADDSGPVAGVIGEIQ